MEQSDFSYIFQRCTIFWYNIEKKDTEGENMGIGGIIVGLILLLFHVLFLYCIFGDIKRIIVCTEEVYAKVKSVE